MTHFYNDFVGRPHCMSQCDICSSQDNIHEPKIESALQNFRSSYSSSVNFKFQPFVSDFEIDHHLTHTTTSLGVLKHHCSISCTLPVFRRSHFYCFTYQYMLEYAYYTNLSFANRCLFRRCHTLHNELYHDVFQILKNKLSIFIVYFIFGQLPSRNFQFMNYTWFVLEFYLLHLILV